MSVHTKKHPTREKQSFTNISFVFHGTKKTYKYLEEIPQEESNKLAEEIKLATQELTEDYESSSWDKVFSGSRSRVSGRKAYRKAAAMIRGARTREGWTQKQLAKKLNVLQNNLSAYECAKKPVGKRLAKKLATVFKTKPDLFLSDLPD